MSLILALARRVLFLPPCCISCEEALRIARVECQGRGWDAIPIPKEVHEGLRTYRIVTPNDGYGYDSEYKRDGAQFVRLRIDVHTGAVREAVEFTRKRKGRRRGDDSGPASAGCPAVPVPPTPGREAGNTLLLTGEPR
jgi:hypothetical protein